MVFQTTVVLESFTLTAQLIDTKSGNYLWSEVYDRQLENVLAIQEEMARAIVDTLQLTLTWRASGFAQQTSNPECHNLCLQSYEQVLRARQEYAEAESVQVRSTRIRVIQALRSSDSGY